MTIKKTIFSSLIQCLLFSNAFAQSKDSVTVKPTDILKKKYYYQMGIGYNFKSNTERFTQVEEHSDGSSKLTAIQGSWGQGFDISFGMGTKINKSLGIEMELGYLIGAKIKEENVFIVNYFGIQGTDKQSASYKANTFRINPKFIFEIPLKNENAFYGKIGYQIGWGNGQISYEENVFYEDGGKGAGTYKYVRRGGIVNGTTTALGFRFKVEQDISFFMELTANNLSRKYGRMSMTEAIENNQNVIDKRTVYSKETVFVDNLIVDPNTPINEDKPREVLSFKSNYSSVGFKIGFISHF